jgi:hypothetical protein
MRPRRAWFASPAVVSLALVVTAGCEEPRNVGDKPRAQVKKAAPEDTFIVGKTTQKIGRADDPALKKGAVVAPKTIVAKDYLTIQGNAYVYAIDKTAQMKIDYAIKLFQAANDRYPADYNEFKKEIIEANNIALPKPPFYQEYVYDEKTHQLVIYEYPEKKAGPMPGQPQ